MLPESTPVEEDVMCHNGRRLPTLFVIGAQKCATTSIVHKLFADHGFSPGLPFDDGRYSDDKEHHFFDIDERLQRGLDYYSSSFPTCAESTLTLDGTPDYLHSRGAAAHLASIYGPERLAHTTFVVSLCEPVRRAQSALYHFRHFAGDSASNSWVRQSKLLGSTAAHIQSPTISFRELVRRDADAARRARYREGSPHDDFGGALYLWGRYAVQLDEWLSAVGELRIIPLPLYSRHEHATLLELACLVRQRSGRGDCSGSAGDGCRSSLRRPPAEAECDAHEVPEPPPGALIGAGSHPPLPEDIAAEDAAALAQSFASSNQHVYNLIAEDPRVAVLPRGFDTSEYAGFLELRLPPPAPPTEPSPPVAPPRIEPSPAALLVGRLIQLLVVFLGLGALACLVGGIASLLQPRATKSSVASTLAAALRFRGVSGWLARHPTPHPSLPKRDSVDAAEAATSELSPKSLL